jgi:NADH-quinone oxidoreductase subunit N
MNTATFSLATLAPAIPEIALALCVLALLVMDAFLREEDRYVTYWLAIASLVGTALLTAYSTGRPTLVTFQGMFVADLMSQVLKVATLLTVAATLVMSRTYLQLRGLLTGEFLCLACSARSG